MKQRLCSAVLTVCLLLAILPLGVLAAESQAIPFVTAVVDGTEICSVETEGKTRLFLPASADLSHLALRFADGENVKLRGTNGTLKAAETLDLTTIAKEDREGCYVIHVTTPSRQKTIYIMQGSKIPTVYLASADPEQDRSWVDQSKKNEAKGTMKMVSADGSAVVYDGGLTQIKPRGNSTFTYSPKKAYQIKLKDKTDLLGNGEKNKTWVLLANYGDATLMHDKLMKDLAVRLGMPYVVSCEWVNLYYDGEYRGVYTIGEKNDVGSTGVDITDMEKLYEEMCETYGDDMIAAEARNAYGQTYYYTENLTAPENLTGGWMIELNLQNVDEASGFFTRKGVGLNVKSPEYADKAAMEYISEYYQAFEDAVYAVDAKGNYTGYNAATGKYFYEYVDQTSLIRTFLLQELALNPDGFRSSLYFHKDKDGMMYAGPIWDQDMTFGTGWEIYIAPTVVDYHYLAEALIRIPAFRTALEEYFQSTFLPEIEGLLGEQGIMAGYKATLADNAAMNYKLWPYVRIGYPKAEGHLWNGNPNYDVVTADMADWVAKRIELLKTQFLPKPAAASQQFPDIRGHEAEEAINFVVEQGLFGGMGDGFAPNTPMSRAMLATVLYRMAGSPAVSGTSFTDVAADAWYSRAAEWASQQGILDGQAGLFRPTDTVSREQMALALYRYARHSGMKMTAGGSLSGYTDRGTVSSQAKTAVTWAVSHGILKGRTETMLAPLSNISRGQAAMSIEQFVKLTQK
ncbi:MAG: CotH kinase family protein [Clostridia bacterium]|nr:CotH kinase family protein [Clostridia bacterium]